MAEIQNVIGEQSLRQGEREAVETFCQSWAFGFVVVLLAVLIAGPGEPIPAITLHAPA